MNRVERRLARARERGFELSCEPDVGALLAALAAAVPPGGRIAETGTGAGVGLAWLVHGLGSRRDVRVASCEVDPDTARLAAEEDWPDFVALHACSFFDVAPQLGPADLVFADSGAGKWEGLDVTLDLVRPGGVLVMDDMTPAVLNLPNQKQLNEQVVTTVRGDGRYQVAELGFGSGVLLATRRHEAV